MSKSGTTYWEITYYENGMAPQLEQFDKEEEALTTWEKWKADPYKGATSLKRITVLDRK